jgi:hypothetical protein
VRTELIAIAKELINLGNADPAQLAKDLETLALVGDALSSPDLSGLAKTLDALRDGFDLTDDAARRTLVQIVAMSKGKVTIAELSEVVIKNAAQLRTLGVDAQGAAAGLVALVDAGVPSAKATASVVKLLADAQTASKKAREEAAAGNEGDAKAYTVLATAFSAANIAQKGLVGALADLDEGLGSSRAQFAQAGLGVNEWNVAVAASRAVANGATGEVKSYADSLRDMQEAAGQNRESASALAVVIKNELNAQLTDLGNVFLPVVISAMTTLADTFVKARREGNQLSRTIDELAELEGKRAKFRIPFEAASIDRGSEAARLLVGNPASAGSLDESQIKTLIAQFLKLRDLAGEGFFSKPLVSEFNAALEVLRTQLAQTIPAAEDAARATGNVPPKNPELTNTGIALSTLVNKYESARDAARGYVEGLDSGKSKLEQFRVKQVDVLRELDKAIAALPVAQRAAAMVERGTIFDQMAIGAQAFKDARAVELTESLAAAMRELGDSGVQTITSQYDALIKTLRETAKEGDELQTTESKLAATRARELIPQLIKQRDVMLELLRSSREVEKAYDAVQRTSSQPTAIGGIDLSAVARAIATKKLSDEEARLTTVLKDQTLGVDERRKAEEQLADAIAKRLSLQGATNTEVNKAADLTRDFGVGLRDAAQLGLALVQILGSAGEKIGQTLAGLVSIGDGLAKIGESAGKAGGLFSKDNIGDTIAGATSLIGGVAAVAQAFDIFGTQAKERARAMKEASIAWGRALEEFAIVTRSTLEESLRRNLAQAEQLVKQAAATTGVKTGGVSINSTQDLRKQIADLDEIAAFAAKRGTDSFARFRDELIELLKVTERNEAALKAENVARVATATKNLEIRRLEALGDTEAASIARLQLSAQEELNAAMLDGTVEGLAYVAALQDVAALELAAAEAAAAAAKAQREYNDALNIFNIRARILGLEGADQLTAVVEYFSALFPQIADALDGVDVSTEAGIETLRARFATLFEELAADGVITEAEQRMIDAFFSILDAATNVANGVETAADRVNTTVQSVGTTNSVLGGSATTQIQRTIDALLGSGETLLAPILDALLDFDVTTPAGVDAAKAKLRAVYEALLVDGITADEEILVGILQTLLGSLDGVLAEFDAAAQEKAAARSAAAKRRSDDAALDIALNDLDGADAFVAQLGVYGEAFASLFAVFDVSTLDGISGASTVLKDLADDLKAMTDEEIVARFGMTRDEVVSAILAMDSSLFDLAGGLHDAADAATDFLFDINQQYLEAIGQGLDAQLIAIQQWVDTMIEEATRLGLLSDAFVEQINTIADYRRAAAEERAKAEADRIANAKAREQEREASQQQPATSTRTVTPREPSSNTAQRLVGLSDVYGIRMLDYLASMLVEERATRVAAVRLADLFTSGVPSGLLVPALPSTTGSGGIVINATITFTGNLTGMTPQQAAQDFVRTMTPLLNDALGRAAGIDRSAQGLV